MQIKVPFFLAWPVGNLVGAALGACLGWFFLWLTQRFMSEGGAFDLLGVIILMPTIGFGLGIGQWLSIRRYLSKSAWWILATALGWLLGLSVDFTVQQFTQPTPWLGFVMAGLYQGAIQWLLIRKRGWFSIAWLLVSAIGWGAAGYLYQFINQPLNRLIASPLSGQIASVLGWAIIALFFGLLTAPVIIKLLKKTR